MGAGMCKEVAPGAGVEGVGRGGTWVASGGCRDTVDRALERILRRKTQVIQGTNSPNRSSALKNGSPLRSPTAPTSFVFMDQAKGPASGASLKGPRSPPIGKIEGTIPSPPLRDKESTNPAPSAREEPPVRPPRRKDRLRKPNLPLPRRNQSAVSLPHQGDVPEEAAARLESYLKRCHSMGTVPVLLEELTRTSSISSLSSSTLESPLGEHQVLGAMAGDRLPSFASVTPPPSPSSTPPRERNTSSHAPHFFIGSRGRSASSSSAQDPPSPMNPYVDMWGDSSGRRPVLRDGGDGMHDLIRKLRRVRSQGEPERPQSRHRYHHGSARSGVEPMMENVIDMLPTRTSGPPDLSLGRTLSSPQIATAPGGHLGISESDRNNPRTILLRILGEYQCLPGSGALARAGKRGEEEELAALEKQLNARWAYIGKRKGKEEAKKEEKKKKEEGEEEYDSDSSSVTPSLGELEEALAHMLDEDDWEEKEEERVIRGAEERAREGAEARLRAEAEGGGPSLSLRMKRENTFTALSALARDE